MPVETILKQFGLSEKAVKVYLSLLTSGPLSVRGLSLKTGINRGSSYDVLKELQSMGLVSYYHKETKQYFAAENPDVFKHIAERKREDFEKNCRKISDILPELKSLYSTGGKKPVARFYEGYTGTRQILENVLEQTSEYSVYSAESIRPYLYKEFPQFTKERINKKISVKVIALGKGGEKRGLDERKWLTKKDVAPTYTIIFNNKIAMISVDENNQPHGVIIEDEGIYKTQKLLFESLWELI